MYNIIIFISDLNLIKNMGTIIFNNLNTMNLVGIVSTHKELEALCKKQEINLVILPEEKYNFKPIQNIIKNVESTIVICDSDTSSYIKNDNLLFLSINDNESCILNLLCKFNICINNQFIKHKAMVILEQLKFDFKFIGSSYFLDAIVCAYNSKENYKFENLEKYIYPCISQKYNISLDNIKGAIVRSINSAKRHLSPKDFNNLNMIYPDKITSKSLITEIINHL